MKTPLFVTLFLPLCALAASLTGHLSSPTGTLPPLRVYAWSTSGRLVAAVGGPSQPVVRFEVPPGRYRLFATPADPGVPLVYAGHTQCSLAQAAGGCASHALRWITVADGQAVSVDINDWRIEEAEAATLDHVLHQPPGADEPDPSGGAPRFFEYPGVPLKRSQATRLTGADETPAARARLTEALRSGRINFAGRAAVVELPCGVGCRAARILDLETGRVTPVPLQGSSSGLTVCPERIAYRRDSRLLRIGIDEGDGLNHLSYYVWDPESAQLRPLGPAPERPPSHCASTGARLVR